MSTVLSSAKSRAIKGPGLKAAGIVVLQFLLILIIEAFEYSFFKVGLWTGLAILISFAGGIYLGRTGTSLTNAVNPPIAFLISTLLIMSTLGGAGLHATKIGLDLVTSLSSVAPYLVIGAALAWISHFAIHAREIKATKTKNA